MKKTFLLIPFCCFTFIVFSQKKDSIQVQPTRFFAGQVTATNNGISLIPAFTLGKPALLFDLSIGRGRLSFDPMIRFGMNGKPWSFIFWWRYKVVDKPKFKMSLGTHPSVVFRDVSVMDNGIKRDYLNAQRFFAWELAPTYFPNKKIGFGVNYLGSHGLTKDIVQYTTFVVFKVIAPNISLNKHLYLSLIPQVFYLKMDKLDGTYASGIIALSKRNFPVNISSIMSKKLDSQLAGKDFVWNLQLNYNINNKYTKK
jgi:hypothetical protein